MTVTIKIRRDGQAIRSALAEVSDVEAARFVEEYRDALTRAAGTLDLSEAEAVLTRWWGIATLRANPPTDAERELVRRLRAGEDVGWSSPAEYVAARAAT